MDKPNSTSTYRLEINTEKTRLIQCGMTEYTKTENRGKKQMDKDIRKNMKNLKNKTKK